MFNRRILLCWTVFASLVVADGLAVAKNEPSELTNSSVMPTKEPSKLTTSSVTPNKEPSEPTAAPVAPKKKAPAPVLIND
jgi:hypothetical protein